MNNSKLTAKLAARYYGCEVICVSTGFHYVLDADILSAIENGVEYMLLPTPLSAITNEHAIEVYYALYPKSKINAKWVEAMFIRNWLVHNNRIQEVDTPLNYTKTFDLLRSLGYDCDNAISEGWAVDRLAFVK